MEQNQLVKKSLFKLKKVIVYDRKISFDSQGKSVITKVAKKEPIIGVITPYFDTRTNSIDTTYVSVTTLDGCSCALRAVDIELETTRITDTNVKEKLNKIIEHSKQIHKFNLEKQKFYEDFKKKELKLEAKTNKYSSALEKLVNQLKKAQGFITIEDTLKPLNKILSNELVRDNWLDCYTCNLSNGYQLNITFRKNTISYVTLDKSISVTRWCKSENYDFIYEEYDRTLHICDLDNSEDFKKLKKQYLKTYIQSDLNKANAKVDYSAGIGDKDILSISESISSELNIELKRENLKEITKRVKALVDLI